MESKKVILVTGANRGIGKAIVEGLLNQAIVYAGMRKPDTALFPSGQVKVVSLDITNDESIDACIEQISKDHGHLDVLINNAGIMLDKGQSMAASRSDLNQTFNTNVNGGFVLIQKALSLLKKSEDPRIINISSGMGAYNELGPGYLAYRLSKLAMNGLTRILAVELRGIKINAMCPGWVKTDMGGSGAHRSPEKGAETAIWLSFEHGIPTGAFFRDKKQIPW